MSESCSVAETPPPVSPHIVLGDQNVSSLLIMSSTTGQLTPSGIISHALVSIILYSYFFSCNLTPLFLLLVFYQPLLSLP